MPDFSVFRPRDEKESRFFKWTFLLLIVVFVVVATVLAPSLFWLGGESTVSWADWFFWWPGILLLIFMNSFGHGFGSYVVLISLVWWLFLSAVIADVLMIVRRSRLEKGTLVAETD